MQSVANLTHLCVKICHNLHLKISVEKYGGALPLLRFSSTNPI